MQEEVESVVTIPHTMVQITGKGTIAVLDYCRGGKLIYHVDVEDKRYTFPIDVTDRAEVGDAKFELEDKASIFRRYIIKAIKAFNTNGDKDDVIRWTSI